MKSLAARAIQIWRSITVLFTFMAILGVPVARVGADTSLGVVSGFNFADLTGAAAGRAGVLGGAWAAGAPAAQHGPPASPLSWEELPTTQPSAPASFTPPGNVLGAAIELRSVRKVAFSDERPYGEDGRRRTVWLARYEAVPVQADSGRRCTSVTLSLAFDAAGGGLLCALTDPAPTWARSPTESKEIESRGSWNLEVHPAEYENLRSTLTGVLGALWENFAVDPTKAGQIVIRPRFVKEEVHPKNAITGEPIVQPPTNVWFVEVLGTVVMSRGDWFPTVLVAQFRDGDLKMLIGEVMQ